MFNNFRKLNWAGYALMLVLTLSFAACTSKAPQSKLVKYDAEIDQVIAQMTLQEKVDMLHGHKQFASPGVERLGIAEMKYTDGPFGIREELEERSWNALGLTTDFATFFPTGSALAATWSPEMAYMYGVGMGQEAKSRGKDVLLAPAINITRVPINGRTFEYLSEDPFLNSRLSVQYTLGVQDQDVAVSLKHFALNNQETNRSGINVIVSERAQREIYLPPFEAAVKEGDAYTVMSAYNKVYGEYCSENDTLLNQILRDEWGFKGLVVSDWGGTHSTKALANGLNVEMPWGRRNFMAMLVDSVEAGVVPMELIDRRVKEILRVRFAITPVPESEANKQPITTDSHKKIVYDIASKSIVLLKNDDALPLNLDNINTIGVIGENAVQTHAHGGFGAGVKASYEIVPLEGLKAKIGDKAEILYAQGWQTQYVMLQGMGRGFGRTTDENLDEKLLKEALEVAKKSDVVLFFAGANHQYETEGTDRQHLALPFAQDQLLSKVAEVNPNIITIVVAGSPYDLANVANCSKSILMSWFNGSEGGNALADVLTGKVNPSGKLPFTYPAKLEDSPAFALGTFPGNREGTEYKEDLLVGYRWFDTKQIKPLYAFGFGLSYSDFEYSNISTDKSSYSAKDTIRVTVDLKNVGKVAGEEVVQAYVSRINASVQWPAKELKAFARVAVEPGSASQTVLKIPVSNLRYWNKAIHDWSLEKTDIEILVGGSSDNIVLSQKVSLK